MSESIPSISKFSVTRGKKEYNYWRARYTSGKDPKTGKQLQKEITGRTKKEVIAKLRKEWPMTSGKIDALLAEEKSVGEWLDDWQASYLNDVKTRTKEIYAGAIKNHIKPSLGEMKLKNVTTQDVQRFLNDLLTRKRLSVKTVKDIRGVLHRVMNDALRFKMIEDNPCTKCRLPKEIKPEIKPFDDETIDAFLRQIKGDELETLMVLTLFTGMREGEVMGLTWDCVDFSRGCIVIRQQLERFRGDGKGYYDLVPTKNSRSREVAVPEFIMDKLREHKKAQEEQKIDPSLYGVWGNPWNIVFTNEIGEPLTNNRVYRHFKRAAIAIGWPDARFHDLRHSYAVVALRNGDPIKTVQEALGHASASFTLDRYGHVTDTMREESAKRMEKYYRDIISNKGESKNKDKVKW